MKEENDQREEVTMKKMYQAINYHAKSSTIQVTTHQLLDCPSSVLI